MNNETVWTKLKNKVFRVVVVEGQRQSDTTDSVRGYCLTRERESD